MATEFERLAFAGMTEGSGELSRAITIAGTSITRGTIQDVERGKQLMENAGFEPEAGGVLTINKLDAVGVSASSLSGKIVTFGGISRRITSVQETRIAYVCQLQPPQN